MITTLGSATHVGLKRTNNEDSYGAFPELGLWLVADGMGGADAGEVASRIAVDQVRAACAEGAPVEAAIEEANRAVGEAIAARRDELVSEYTQRTANPYVAAERGYVDDVIQPSETRRKVAAALRVLRSKREDLPKRKHGNVPL